MKYGENYESYLINSITGKKIPTTCTYRYVSYDGFHTDNTGHGIWNDDRQLVGTCDFSVAGCNEKSAKAKLRKWVKNYRS